MGLVDFDIEQLIPQSFQMLLGGSQLIEAFLDAVAEGARAKWVRLAQTTLDTARENYIKGIQRPEVRPGERIIALVGWLPQAVEQGLASFDLRKTLLNDNAKISWSGAGRSGGMTGHKYRPIPFRHAGPGATTSRAGTPVGQRLGPTGTKSLAHPGYLGKDEARKLGRRVWKAAKQAAALGKPLAPGAGGVKKLAEHHKTDIYAGMKQGGSPRHEGMVTFRTISEANPEGWLHPGIQARNLIGRVEDYARDLAVPALRNAINNAMAELAK